MRLNKMEQKKDIGTLFENKLNDGRKAPNKSLWDKINRSLDEEKRRKKRILFYWFLGGGLSVLLGLLLLFGNGFSVRNQSAPQKENITFDESINTHSKKVNNEVSFKISEVDSLKTKNSGAQKLQNRHPSIENLKRNETVPLSENNFKGKAEQVSTNNNPLDETFIISEKYYYYNSRTGQQLVTESKKEIDSLILQLSKSTDSITPIKNDSLHKK